MEACQGKCDHYMRLVARKPVLGVADQLRDKPEKNHSYRVTEASLTLEIVVLESSEIINTT